MLKYYDTTQQYDNMFEWILSSLSSVPQYYIVWLHFFNKQIEYLSQLYHKERTSDRNDGLRYELPSVQLQSYLNSGLLLFPRSPHLLYLQASIYHRNNLLGCAFAYYKESLELKSFVNISLPKYADDWSDGYYNKINNYMNRIYSDHIIEANLANLQALLSSDQQYNFAASSSIFSVSNGTHGGRNISGTAAAWNKHICDSEHSLQHIINNYDKKPIQLHIGCTDHTVCVKSGWLVVDVYDSLITHIRTTVSNLSLLPSGSVSSIYSSHVLEHLSYSEQNCEVCEALLEWRRVLRLGGVSRDVSHIVSYCLILACEH
jgi:hypothetical protein